MPWYYAGPDAQPTGPVTLEELHARRVNGTISPETYVIEHTGLPNEPRGWKRFREVFPASPTLPPLPTASLPAIPPPRPPAPLSQPQPHPLFPSAALAPTQPPIFSSPAGPDPYYAKAAGKTNAWCAWGFWLGLASPFLIIVCGMGTLLALIALFLCLGGLLQVQHHQEQSGRGLAIFGLLFSGLTLLLTVIILAFAIPAAIKHEQTTTEQSSNDSE